MKHLLTQTSCLNIALRERDPYTEDHASRVDVMSRQLGIKCGLSSHELNLLKGAAKLHDIGKIGIPDRILLKFGSLDADEWEVMKTHAELGERICLSIAHRDAEQIASIVRHHHEYYNGAGYPDGLAGEAIPICSRIISIVDSYDAMKTARPYHRARTHQEVMAVIDQESATKTDTLIYRYFKSIITTVAQFS
jgi:HD-GYP domain-containing protein (c-di-GMP phosphodiesterase class II)